MPTSIPGLLRHLFGFRLRLLYCFVIGVAFFSFTQVAFVSFSLILVAAEWLNRPVGMIGLLRHLFRFRIRRLFCFVSMSARCDYSLYNAPSLSPHASSHSTARCGFLLRDRFIYFEISHPTVSSPLSRVCFCA